MEKERELVTLRVLSWVQEGAGTSCSSPGSPGQANPFELLSPPAPDTPCVQRAVAVSAHPSSYLYRLKGSCSE